LDANGAGPTSPGAWLAVAALIQTLVESDRAQDARTLSEMRGMVGPTPESAYCLSARVAQGRLAVVAGDLTEGVHRLMAVRRISIERAWHHPGVAAEYLTPLASALVRINRPDLGAAILREELARARAFGAVRPLSTALRGHGVLTGGKAGLRAIDEA